MSRLFIINPVSGANRRRPWLKQRLLERLALRGIAGEVRVTTRPGEATEWAARAVVEGVEVVVAVGGDGTMNEVAQGLVGSDAALGLLPCGSGNGLALHLGVPKGWEAALDLVCGGGAVLEMDTGIANGSRFCNAMGFGLDAEISERFNGLERRGLAAYLRTGLGAVRRRAPVPVTINARDVSLSGEALLVTIANSDQYGNHARIAPGARVDDGELDLTLIRPMRAPGLLTIAAKLFLGGLGADAGVFRARAPRFIIKRATPGLIHTDGETHWAPASFEVCVQPRSLRVIVPPSFVASAPSISSVSQLA